MTSPLDEISFQLGQLAAGQAMLLSRADKRDNQTEEFKRSMDELKQSVGEIKTRIKPITEDMAWMKPQVTHYKSIRRKMVWLGGAVVTTAGIIGGTLSDWAFRKLTGSEG